MHNSKRLIIFGCLLVTTLAGPAAAASPTTERVNLTSQTLDETRPLNIVLPEDYSPDGSYPVVYALDGDPEYILSLATRMHAQNPELIVVGVENVDRTRDMFPEALEAKGGRGGGGGRFLEFIKDELIPFVEGRFATGDFRVLSGQSNSGFFVLYAMLHTPDTFDAFLASSPMIGWDWDMIRDKTTALLAGCESFPKALFMNRGETDYDKTTDFLQRYVDLLEKTAPADFRMRTEIVAGGGHVPENSYGNGIAFIFHDR